MDKPNDCKSLDCAETDDRISDIHGVLLSQDIKYFAEKYKLVTPFKEDNLKPSGIRLCLGKEYAIGGELKELTEEPGKNLLTIDPFQVAIISTAESINLPRFLIARWNLRVSLVYQGLLWTGALQVDAGWCGPLYCPIYNLSNEPVHIKLGESIVLMDFVRTSDFVKNESKEYTRHPNRRTLKDYNYKLKSALFTEAAGRVDKLEKDYDKKINDYDKRINRVESLAGLLIASIAILFAALSVLVTSRDVGPLQINGLNRWPIVWQITSIGISIFALYFSITKYLSKLWSIVIFLCAVLVFSLTMLLTSPIIDIFILILKSTS